MVSMPVPKGFYVTSHYGQRDGGGGTMDNESGPEGAGNTTRGLTTTTRLGVIVMAESQPTHIQPEEWRPVPGYEGRYSVSNQGRVRREGREYTDAVGRLYYLSEIVLVPHTAPSGHQQVALIDGDHKARSKLVHHLVLLAFVGERPDGMEACHYNDTPSDNRLVNLRWASRSDNMRDRVRNGRHPQSKQTHCKRGHEFTKENTRIETSGSRRCRTCERERQLRRVRR